MGRVIITYSLPPNIKNKIENLVRECNYKQNKKETLSSFTLKSVLLNLKVQNIKNFNDLKEVWSEIFINNKNINLQNKLKIMKDFKKELEKEIKELEEYFAYKKLKNLNDESIKKVEELGEMASWIIAEMKKGKENEIN